MENQSQVPTSIRRDKSIPVVRFKSPSKVHVAKVVLKLLPFIINFRKDRREWVKREGKNINEKKYRKHAESALRTFIELGPSYIKLGQWLSTRADIFPQPYLEVLATLQDDVPPAPFSKTRPVIENELGNIEKIFETFDTRAFSGASLGQVYRATYNGQQVIVKVARPEIEQIIAKDIAILKSILPLATRFIDPNLRFSAEAMLSQFIETVYEEMDYNKESDNLISIKQNLKGESVVIPNVILELTSKHVITLEYIQGIKITDISSLDNAGIDREKLVIKVHHIFFKMLLQQSIFHADPHPGNISVTNAGEIILYDFGMVGRLENETRLKLIRLYLSLIEKDPSRAVNVLIELGTLEPNINRYIVEKALELSIQSLHGKEVDRMEVRALMELTNKTLSKFPFRLPKNLALYMRMASILEGIYHYHSVRFQFVRVLVGLLEEEGLIKEAYMEEFKRYVSRFVKGIEISSELAPMIKQYLTDQKFANKQSKYSNIIPISIISSSIVIGSALIFPYDKSLSYLGFALSAALLVGTFIYKK